MITKLKATIIGLLCMLIFTACDALQKAANTILAPSNLEMALGLKEALNQGLFKSFDAYSNPQNNPAIAFIFPKDAQKIIDIANKAGLGSVVTKTTDKFNKAVASSFTAAKPIFLDAVKSMNISDVANILITNNTHAATDYFKTTTTNSLMAAFRPIVDSTIKVDGANKEWKKIADVVNMIPFSNFKVETSLTDFVAARAIEGMFNMVAQEEANIRTNISFRQTDLTKKVFGYADEQLKKQSTGQ